MEPSKPGAVEVFGFNTEVSYRNFTYHVQTENMTDPPNPTINTLVYLKGTLVKKVSSPYADLLDAPDSAGAIQARVKRQHQTVLSSIKRGELSRPV